MNTKFKSVAQNLPTWEERKLINQKTFDSWIESMTRYDTELPAEAGVLIEIVNEYKNDVGVAKAEDTGERIYNTPEKIAVQALTNEDTQNEADHFKQYVYRRFGPVESWAENRFTDETISTFKPEEPKYCMVEIKWPQSKGTTITEDGNRKEYYLPELKFKFVRKLR